MDWPALASCDLCPAGANGLGSVWGCEVQPIGYIPQPTQEYRVQIPDRASVLTLVARRQPSDRSLDSDGETSAEGSALAFAASRRKQECWRKAVVYFEVG